MWLNCDLGESYGAWQMGLDSQVMPYIDAANIACGFHAGDADVMATTLLLAKQHKVVIGAHPSYPDKQGFGRRSMQLGKTELINCLHYQIAALEGMAKVQGLTLHYVKPHGALYNDMMRDSAILQSVMQAVASYAPTLKLMLLATQAQTQHMQLAEQYKLNLLFEAFADRLYDDEGMLVARSQPNAVHCAEKTLEQVLSLSQFGYVTTVSNRKLMLKADTLCVHGDNLDAIEHIRQIRALLTPI